MTSTALPFDARRWRPPHLIESAPVRWLLTLGAVIYLSTALQLIDVNWARVSEGWDRGLGFLLAFTQPDFVTQWRDISAGLTESLTMTVAATALGILFSVPIGLGAARNVAPPFVYFSCRALITAARTFQEIILAIFFVAMFGFGPFAGLITLIIASIGFFAKLLAEEIEAIDPSQAEAIRSTGASWLQWINYGIQPQIMPRFIGLSIYRLDINFRESAVVGIVGGGGIGATLNTAFDRYEFETAAAILLIIIAIVMATEYFSGFVRARVR
ncbi:MAG: phosphonate ABC transporter, permease protein PhnE [Pseudomonadales bacterium]|nr:phosphonate ABC transporter, permease protein PhnE [Pseudomonadales bacterium]